MIRPNYRDYRKRTLQIQHSAKGSEWDDHKYVKKIDGVYYYPVGYEDGRTVDFLKDNDKNSEEESKSGNKDKSKEDQINEVKNNFDQYLTKRGIDWRTLPKDEIDQMQRDIVKQLESGKETGTAEKSTEELAKDVAAGKLGNGEDRKKLLGDRYDEVQKIVNSSAGSKNVSEASEDDKNKIEEAVKKISSKSTSSNVHSGVDMSKVLEVYKKKK